MPAAASPSRLRLPPWPLALLLLLTLLAFHVFPPLPHHPFAHHLHLPNSERAASSPPPHPTPTLSTSQPNSSGHNPRPFRTLHAPIVSSPEELAFARELSSGLCDVTVGKWVQDSRYPLYRPDSCPYVQDRYDCHRNGRRDTGFLKWRWKPKDCHIPRFDATILLEILRNKRLVFIGDSLNRNQAESLMCLLREGIPDKSRLLKICMDRDDFEFKFLDYNCVVEFHRSSFLVDVVDEGLKDAQGRSIRSLQLAELDKTKELKNWRGADVLIFNTGHWWNHWKTTRGKIKFFRDSNKIYPEMDLMVALRMALKTWAAWVDKHCNQTTAKVFFSGFSPIHFRGGRWNTGGGCRNETQPIFNDSALAKYPPRMLIAEDVIRHMKTPVKILNISRLSDYRQDAHPSVYGHRPDQKRGEDCSHWCLPGVPDLWNELLYAYLIADTNLGKFEPSR